MTILTSKVTRPVPPPQIVDRPRIYARLDQWQRTPVIFVHAPAGYGKSMLASRWIEVRGLDAQTAWLSLDPGDDDPLQFLHYLAAAFEPLAPGMETAIEPLLDEPDLQPERVLAVLLGMLQRDPKSAGNDPLLLVLDDLQQINSPALAPLMTLLLERSPARLHFLLLGRMATYGPLTRLYAAEQVLEVREVELRFQPQEMATYLAQRGFAPLAPEALARLDARTEGWIVALQMIAAVARDKRDIDELLAAAQSKHGWLAEYLTSQILANIIPEERTFLVQTAILDRFNRSLLATVSGVTDVDALLSSLVEAGLPLVQLDSRQEWMRYHHLFQETLQARLRQELSSTAIAELHRRAASWLAEHDQISAAVQHALSAEDLNLAAAILETAVRPEILRGGVRQAQAWLALLPDNALDRHPRLLLDLCLLGVLRFQASLVDLVVRTETALAAANLAEAEHQHAHDELTIYKIYAQFFNRKFTCVKELIEQNDQRLADANPLTESFLKYMQMYLAWHEGKRQVALAKGYEAIEAFKVAGLDDAVISVRRNYAQMAASYGNTREAVAMHKEIVATTHANRSFALNELAETHASAIFIHYWMDDIERAQRAQQSALALAQRLNNPVLTREITALTSLFAIARATRKSSEIEDFWPLDKMGHVLPLNRLNLHNLVRQGQVERAWHFAMGFGVQVEREILPENLAYFVSMLEATIARGTDLETARLRIAAAIAQAEHLHSRSLSAELHALASWNHLQMGNHEEAKIALGSALDLAVATGYVRFILDIPALAPLLAVMDHPAAARMWVATVPEAQRRQAAQLTDRERRVLAHLTQPGRYQDIADRLGISINTVRKHVTHIYRKLGVSKREDAVTRARALGLTTQDDPAAEVKIS